MHRAILRSFRFACVSCAVTLALAAAAQTVPPTPAPAPTDDETVNLSPFQVAGTAVRGYGSAYSLGSTRIAMPSSDVSSYVVTVNEQLLQDTGAISLQQAMKYVAGVTNTSSSGNGRLSIRGYDAMGSSVRDGLPGASFVDSVNPLDLAQYDRVEVIKGPNGLLYGSHSLGGLFNRVTKRPTYQPQTEITGEFSSYNTYRGTIDTSASVGSGNRLGYRLIATYENGDSFGKQGGTKRQTHEFTAINPQIQYRITPESSIRAWVSYTKSNIPRAPYTYGDSLNKPHTFWGTNYAIELSDVFENVVNWEYEVSYTNAFKIFDSDWALNMVARGYQGKNQWLLDTPLGNIRLFDAAGNFLGLIQNVPANAAIAKATTDNFFRRWWDDEAENWLTNVDLTGKFVTGPVHHVFFTSAQEGIGDSTTRQFQSLGTTPVGGYQIWPTLQIPNLGTPNSIGILPNATTFSHTEGGLGFNWAAQDSVYAFGDRLILVGGARYDKGKPDTITDTRLATLTTSTAYNQWTPKYGVIVKPFKGLSMFYNQTQTFSVTSAIDRRLKSPTFGQRFPNSTGTTKEGGVKVQLFDNRVIATASYFDTRLTNVLATIIDDDFGTVTGVVRGGYQLPSAGAVDRGYEVDVAAEVTKDIDVIASYSTLVAKTNTGLRQRNAPGVTGAAFARYNISHGAAKGLTFGAGVQHTGSRSWDAGDTASLDAYTTVDVFASYAYGRRWNLQMNVRNVGDKVYLQGSTNRNAIFWGEPRMFQLTARYKL